MTFDTKESANPDPVEDTEDARSKHLQELSINGSNRKTSDEQREHSPDTRHSRRSWLPRSPRKEYRPEPAKESERRTEGGSLSLASHKRHPNNHHNWFERHDALKGKKVSEKPCKMEMLFFDTTKNKAEKPQSKESSSEANEVKAHKFLLCGQWNEEEGPRNTGRKGTAVEIVKSSASSKAGKSSSAAVDS